EIVDLDGEIGHGCARAAFGGDAELGRGVFAGGEGHDPAVIHDDVHVQDVGVEGFGLADIGRGNIGYDAFDRHVCPLSAVALILRQAQDAGSGFAASSLG